MMEVLFVDDDQGVLDVTKRFLERGGQIHVDTCVSAQDALDRLKVTHYDAIISDYAMPGLGGVEFLRMIKLQQFDIPIIVFTAKEREQVLIEVLNSGADFFLQKGEDARSQFTELKSMVTQAVMRRQAESALRESEELFRSLVNSMRDATLILGQDGTIQFANAATYSLIGLAPGRNLLGVPIFHFIDPAYHDRMRRDLSRVREEEGSFLNEYLVLTPHGEERYVEGHGTRTTFRGTLMELITIRDVTGRKRSEEALRRSEERFRLLAENARDLIFRYVPGVSHRFEYMSPAAEVITGYPVEQFYKDPDLFFQIIQKEDRDRFFMVMRHPEKSEKTVTCRLIREDGVQIWIEQHTVPILGEQGEMIAIEGVTRDITYRKVVEFELLTSLREKETLLKELHHRVKNNLQVISSLLYLESRNITDPQVIAFLKESRDRIRSMALLHEKLCRSPDYARIQLTDYVGSLIDSLRASFGISKDRISFVTEIDPDIVMGVEEGISCGLIITEIISNSLKYAFPDGRKGAITLTMKVATNGQTLLSISDDGVGIPPGIDMENPSTLGISLVKNLIRQLDGAMEVDRSSGTTYSIRIRASNRA